MKEFTPDKYLGHKINRISRSIDRYFDRKRCSKTECIPRSQGMMIGYMLKSLEKNGYIVRTPMENDARLKRIELTQKALDHENRVRENIMVIEEAMHEGFSKEEFNMMLGFLDRVIDNMEKLNK